MKIGPCVGFHLLIKEESVYTVMASIINIHDTMIISWTNFYDRPTIYGT